ncbi:AMP-dependent synthetase ligase [Fusarium phyllophilum]|uniref:AMP-dependent synthetase ligase n=1 Tax=Fusarium phyllophilum TaxID=47803 RepID=A0A8H5NMY2_9HYPO|nr:AMP-dependent synthetase ligase [Fusarium phyllophilum]
MEPSSESPITKIGLHPNLSHLRGDSITTMQVVSRRRAQNISFKVADSLRASATRPIAQRRDFIDAAIVIDTFQVVELKGAVSNQPYTRAPSSTFYKNLTELERLAAG